MNPPPRAGRWPWLPRRTDPNSWPGFALRGLRNQLLCLLIGALIWLFSRGQRGTFYTAWLYSAAIGTCCWLLIDGGRIVVSAALQRAGRGGTRGGRWPGPVWMAALIIGGTLVGFTLGSLLADQITGFHTASLLDNTAALTISLAAAVGATYYFYARERLHQEQSAAEAARRLATETQLQLLQSQLEPHMLFNTLANLRVLISLDAPRAQAMLDRLVAFLRATLSASRVSLHPLATEFARIDDYLALMAVRMGPRLRCQLTLPDALRDWPVPPLLLQPLVENAVQHGLEPQLAGGLIEVVAARDGAGLRLSVRDTGVGLDTARAQGQAGTGFGTRMVRERLAALYGDQARLELLPAADADSGTLAVVHLPPPADRTTPTAAPSANTRQAP